MSTPTSKIAHPLFARIYARQSQGAEARGMTDQRRELLAGLSGTVVEVGAGNGLNFAHYPPAVDRVIAVEPEPYLRALAQDAAAQAPVPVEVVEGAAEALPLKDGAVDAAVASLVLCSVLDPQAAVAELHRVLRPGGELRFNEHVVSDSPRRARVQRTLDRTIWPHIAGGCHLARDTGRLLEQHGFEIEDQRRFCFSVGGLDPAKAHILGRARRQPLTAS